MQALNPAAEFDYNPRVRELFADLRHAGVLPVTAGLAVAAAGSQEQGAYVRLQAELSAGRVQSVRYQAYGCPHFLAACESLARWLETCRVPAAHDWSRSRLEHELGLPAPKRAKLLILEDALTRLLDQSVAAAAPSA